MADEPEDRVKIAVLISRPLKQRITDVAFICGVSDTQLVTKAIEAYIEAIKEQKGEKFSSALKVIEEAREA